MKVRMRVNNEFFGVLHVSSQDPQEVDMDLVPSVTMILGVLPRDFLAQKGFNKGDLVIVHFNDQRQITSLERMNGELLWTI